MSRYVDIVNKGRNMLEVAGVDDFNTDAWLLFEHIFGMNRTSYFLHQMEENEELNLETAYFDAVGRRCERIPLQHITGHQEFMGFDFIVNENTLVPRQDTEVLVEEAIHTIKECCGQPREKMQESSDINAEELCYLRDGFVDKAAINVLDMCTGTGCIGISLAKFLPYIKVLAADISSEALKVAERNIERLEVSNIELIESDLFKNIDKEKKFKVIVSNPPYIRTRDIEALEEEVKLHDPFIALDGMEDGLHFYREITKSAVQMLENGGYLMYEIGFDQAYDVSEIMKKEGFSQIRVIKDLAGLDRVVTGRLHH